MSLATRCTSCGTAFRVVQDQLKISEGWVRCGKCNAVFNALEGLFDLGRDASPDWESAPIQAPASASTGTSTPPSSVPSEPHGPLTRTDDDFEDEQGPTSNF